MTIRTLSFAVAVAVAFVVAVQVGPVSMAEAEANQVFGGSKCLNNTAEVDCTYTDCGNTHHCIGNSQWTCTCKVYCNSGAQGCSSTTQEALSDCDNP